MRTSGIRVRYYASNCWCWWLVLVVLVELVVLVVLVATRQP